jgi:inhibitor of growth protein 3
MATTTAVAMTVSMVSGTPLTTAHSLALLSEYTHMLDALPLDLSRQFADLRELDAVLSSSANMVTQKIYELIDLIEDGNIPKAAKLKKLAQIAEDVQKLKLGGEDKIRVATQAADSVSVGKFLS